MKRKPWIHFDLPHYKQQLYHIPDSCQTATLLVIGRDFRCYIVNKIMQTHNTCANPRMMDQSSLLEANLTDQSNSKALNAAFSKQKAVRPVPSEEAAPHLTGSSQPSVLDKVVIRYSQSLATNLIFHLSER